MLIKKINKINVADEIFKNMLNLISSGIWKSGSKIPSEKELTENFGASRVSVRAALQKLKALNLLESKYSRGTFITGIEGKNIIYYSLIPLLNISKDNMLDLLEFREIVETANARLAARNKTNEGLKKLEDIIKKMIKDKNNLIMFSKDDLSFHFQIAKIAGNETIIRIYEVLNLILSKYMEKIIKIQGVDSALEMHPKIYNAIKNGDPKKAYTLVKKHIYETKKIFIDTWVSMD